MTERLVSYRHKQGFPLTVREGRVSAGALFLLAGRVNVWAVWNTFAGPVDGMRHFVSAWLSAEPADIDFRIFRHLCSPDDR